MTFKLTPQDVTRLDSSIAGLYPTLGGGELSQFAKLFTQQALINALAGILQPHIRASAKKNVRDSIEIDVGWIDKRPYAKMTGESRKGEIADGAVFSGHRWKNPGGYQITESRCILLQAKAVKNAGQLLMPTVSLNPALPKPNSSTGRELKLLSSWPTFDFFPHAASSQPLVAGLNVQTLPGVTPSHGWFVGTPAVIPSSTQLKTWIHPWLCGPAIPGTPCSESLGSLLARFFSGGQLSSGPPQPVDAGASFSYQYSDFANPSALAGYSRLCVEILRAIDSETISDSWTTGVGVKKRQTIHLHCFPFHLAAQSAYIAIRNCIERLFFTKMPVLLVMRTSEESPGTPEPCRKAGPPPFFLG